MYHCSIIWIIENLKRFIIWFYANLWLCPWPWTLALAEHYLWHWLGGFGIDILTLLTLLPPIQLRLYALPYWSNPQFLISDIRALWRSGLSAKAPECQKLKMVG